MYNISNKNSFKAYIVLFTVLIAIIVTLLIMFDKVDKKEKSFSSASTAMGSYVQQTVYGKNSENAANAAIVDIKNLEKKISWRIDDSAISKINNGSGKEWIDLDDVTLDVLLKSVDVSKRSMQAYDFTILPISKLWDFGGENQRIPSTTEIENNLPLVNYNFLRINEDVKRAKLVKEGSGIDLGAAGKGTACDVAVEAYKNNGADYGIVAVGGSVGVYGRKSNKVPWRIAIRDPFRGIDQSDGAAVVKIDEGFISTSGAYEKCFEKDGIKYHHILNPKTGYPVETDIISVSVVSNNGTMGDLLSTACYVLGKEKSLSLLEHYNAQAIFIDRNKNIYATNGIRDNIIITNEEFKLSDWK